MSTPATTYDLLTYPSGSFPQTHPDLLGTLAGLFGVPAVPLEGSRVLELGCASGGNLLPLAAAWPETRFLGIDYSATQVEIAQRRINQLGLKNVEVRHASILDVDESWGTFDYLICHGVYSWVPQEVQDGILKVCARNLKPDGVGYISYNTLPGWHMRGMIREMMCYHDTYQQDRPPLERVAQARTLLQFLASASKDKNTPYALLLRQELEIVQRQPDGYLFHEHLEEHNDPVYFFEFYQRLLAHDLRYLGEADVRLMMHEHLPDEVRRQLAVVAPNQIQMEQYLDFLSNRLFRQTLVCHASHRPDYALEPQRLFSLRIASPLRSAGAAPDLAPGVPATFSTPTGMSISTPESIVKAALVHLAEVWPRAIPFEELRRQARRRLGSPPEDRDARELGSALLQMYCNAGAALVELWRSFPRFATRAGDRPLASPMARLMAREGMQVTSLKHQSVGLGDFDCQILPLLDGTRTRSALRDQLLDVYRQGQMNLARNGEPVRDVHQARAALTEGIEQQVRRYAEAGLLLH
jgi:methyltransferase-like protein/SAM-dependent methyltransferase